MPDPITGVVGAVTAGGALLSSSNEREAAENAVEAQTGASQAQIDLARETRDQIRSDNEPFRQQELQRANAIGEVFGFSPVSDQQPVQPQQPVQQPNFQNLGNLGNFGNFGDLGGLSSTNFGGFLNSGLNGARSQEFTIGPNGQFVNSGLIGADGNNVFTNGTTSNEGVPTIQEQQDSALSRFEGSPFGSIFTNNFGLETDAIDAGLAGQGLNLSSVRAEAREDARQRNFGSAFGNYFNALSGFPTTGAATQANAQASQNFSNTANSAFGNIGNAAAQGAFAQGQANNTALNGIGSAFGTILGGF